MLYFWTVSGNHSSKRTPRKPRTFLLWVYVLNNYVLFHIQVRWIYWRYQIVHECVQCICKRWCLNFNKHCVFMVWFVHINVQLDPFLFLTEMQQIQATRWCLLLITRCTFLLSPDSLDCFSVSLVCIVFFNWYLFIHTIAIIRLGGRAHASRGTAGCPAVRRWATKSKNYTKRFCQELREGTDNSIFYWNTFYRFSIIVGMKRFTMNRFTRFGSPV